MKPMVHAALIAAVAIAVVLSAPAQAGTLRGTVTVKGAPVARDAVVYIDAIPDAEFKAPEAPAVIDQVDMAFVPRVLPVLAGTTVEFRNSDDVLHNVFSPMPCAGQFNLGTWGKGEKRSQEFTKSGCGAVLLCSVHPEMEGYVIALPTPYFAKTDENGKYAIENVPAGSYTAKVWHAKLKAGAPEGVAVAVQAEGAAQADFAVSK